ncbi:acyl-CoA dehydrogenase family protein [Endozoicomonas numazuensis]|uniref:Acyl-CoA dehydrogenase n=1 Tax=Endozoicomonas numazuensis TaxID=1137799 RepID=A0A081NMJ4_9GAMM|nr:acyl-CoA dehydrogenase family protein [Endozoicomonas numazuensis]KEQ19667.1 acyl-CoA dehydrogenase [Endozoicomonas numazuensis]
MKIEFTPEQDALRQELRAYFSELMTPELTAEVSRAVGEGGGPLFWEAMDKLGKDGWIGVGWPEDMGGRGLSEMEQFIFVEEVMRAGFPFPFLTTESVGPILAKYATARMKEELVSKILGGKMMLGIGYSEPGAGTDLMSLKTTAKKDGDEWVINGQKMWTSLAHHADYIWLAARTNFDPEVKSHSAISIFLVPTDSEGYSCSPVHTLGDVRTNATYYDNVRVPLDHLVGDEGMGMLMIFEQLNRERLSLVNVGAFLKLFNDVTQWASDTEIPGGKTVIDQPWVQINLAKSRAGLEALKLICYRQASEMTRGNLAMEDASAAKVYGTEFFVELYRNLAEVLGVSSTLHRDSKGAVLNGRLEELYRTASIITFGGGTNEVQRDLIARGGLGMPRAKR